MAGCCGRMYGGLSRREFFEASGAAVAVGALAARAGAADPVSGGKAASAIDTRLAVKFVVNGILHEEAFEGSCRVGPLGNLTFEAESRWLEESLKRFEKELASRELPPGIEALPPVSTHLWVEKANPDIMLGEEQLEQLAGDDPKTDVYVVVGGGLPQYVCLRIAERFRKPVILALTPGWGLDAPAGIRRKGLEGFYARDWSELERQLRLLAVRKAFAATKILNVTNFPTGVPLGVVSAVVDLPGLEERLGVRHHTVDYAEFFGAMDQLVSRPAFRREAEELADALVSAARQTRMSREDVVNSVLFHQTVRQQMARHGCNAFTIECFELCSSMNPWRRRFTPCLTHALLKDDGFPSACEKDLNALLAMALQTYLARKAVYMGNPDVDPATDTLTLHHSDASRRLKGLDQPDAPYEIEPFAVAGFGATLRYDFAADDGEEVTLARFDPSGTRLLVTRGEVAGGTGLTGCGCAQQVEIRIGDGRELLRVQQDFGHHLSLVYGDHTRDLVDLGALMGFEVVKV